jgi:hypothetical protein
MGKIVITTNISLDGVVQDPDGVEGFTLGGWFGQFGGKDLEGWAKVETAEALAAGRCCWGAEATNGSPLGGCPEAASGQRG